MQGKCSRRGRAGGEYWTPCVGGHHERDVGMRLKSAVWVAAYIRRCHIEGAFAAVRRRGAEEAGAIFVKLNRLDGTAELFGPGPKSVFDAARPAARRLTGDLGEAPTPKTK